ncbi:unnamed protein product [Vicia faba]|uniref:Uncharacterized protein n=1 Tax=Vicia faba TaxID=3906 RepID=A0AAV0ZVA7_VICFA|nr:unnamed protein product [Vicia faba]
MNPRSKPDSATVLSSYPDSGGLGCGYVMNRWGFAVGSVSMALGDGVADERSSPRDAFMLQQFSNPANTQVHFETTAVAQFPGLDNILNPETPTLRYTE